MRILDFQKKIDIKNILSVEEFDKKSFISFKFNKQKILIKKFISVEEMQAILDTCVEDFFSNYETNGYENKLPYTKLLFQLIVLKMCTNLEINFEEVNPNLVDSNVIRAVLSKIANYKEAWELIETTISYKVMAYSLNLIATSLPNDEALKQNVDEVKNIIQDLNTSNPELLKYMVKEAAKQEVKDLTRKEIKNESKKELTKEKLSKLEEIKEDVDSVLEGR